MTLSVSTINPCDKGGMQRLLSRDINIAEFCTAREKCCTYLESLLFLLYALIEHFIIMKHLLWYIKILRNELYRKVPTFSGWNPSMTIHVYDGFRPTILRSTSGNWVFSKRFISTKRQQFITSYLHLRIHDCLYKYTCKFSFLEWFLDKE